MELTFYKFKLKTKKKIHFLKVILLQCCKSVYIKTASLNSASTAKSSLQCFDKMNPPPQQPLQAIAFSLMPSFPKSSFDFTMVPIIADCLCCLSMLQLFGNILVSQPHIHMKICHLLLVSSILKNLGFV